MKRVAFIYTWSYEDRCIELAKYIIDHSETVRGTAKYFGLSKSTVHKDVTEHLKGRNPALYAAVKVVLEKNKQERHIRGGEATRMKYLRKSNCK